MPESAPATPVQGAPAVAEPARLVPIVRPGIEVLLEDSVHLVRGRRVGIVSHIAGVDRSGVRSVDRLVATDGVDLVAILSPEHGYRGTLDQPDVPDETDSATGLPIYSLYRLSGPARGRFPALLASIDVLLIDLQDIGARTYTYVALAVELMEAAREAQVRVVVLDRPNPIGGTLVQGPPRDSSVPVSFVARLPIPLRHGLTIGELALLANVATGARLTVVPAAGWRRDMWFDATGLPWVNPSPNMPSLESASHYPGTVLFEATNLSVGRGTGAAFQQIGAPWLDTRAVLTELDRLVLPGVHVDSVRFVPRAPTDRKFDGQTVAGVRLTVTDRAIYDPCRTALAILMAVRRVQPDRLTVDAPGFDVRAGNSRVREQIEAGVPLDSLVAGWSPALRAFAEARRAVLLYP